MKMHMLPIGSVVLVNLGDCADPQYLATCDPAQDPLHIYAAVDEDGHPYPYDGYSRYAALKEALGFEPTKDMVEKHTFFLAPLAVTVNTKRKADV